VFAHSKAVLIRAASGVFNDGFIHAGNLAYLSLLTLFPFIIVTAALARLFGQNEDTERAIDSLMSALPAQVAEMLEQPIDEVLHARTGALLWLGALVGLWTVGSFIETIRDILRRAYGTTSSRPFWQHRLRSIGIIIISIILMMAGFTAQVMLTAAEQFVGQLFPMAHDISTWLRVSRIVPAAIVFTALYLMFWSLTPGRYRTKTAPKWPGAMFVMLWWYLTLQLLPQVLARLNGYTLTYGGLAGFIIALLFFWLIGYGLVIGAHLNAALAEPPQTALRHNAGAQTVEEK
jgi:membrane protein